MEQADKLHEVSMQIINNCFSEESATTSAVPPSFPSLSSTLSQSPPSSSSLSLTQFTQSIADWIQSQVESRHLTLLSSLQPYLINQSDAITACKRPFFLSSFLEKVSLQYYQSGTEVFADLMLFVQTLKAFGCVDISFEEEFKSFIQEKANEYQIEIDMYMNGLNVSCIGPFLRFPNLLRWML